MSAKPFSKALQPAKVNFQQGRQCTVYKQIAIYCGKKSLKYKDWNFFCVKNVTTIVSVVKELSIL